MSGFHAGGIRAIGAEWVDEKAGVVRATAVLALALPSPPEIERARLDRLGFKIGLLIRNGQQITSLRAANEASTEDAAVTADLAAVFGTPAGQRWSGRVFAKAPTPLYPVAAIAEYPLELVLTNARELPQLIDAPSRYGNEGSFADSHLTALWAVRIGYRRSA
jgi:hypothetical protein